MQVKYCNPSSQPCVAKVAARNQRECKTSCGGLHADVTFTDDFFDTFVTKQLKKQHSNLAEGKLNKIVKHVNLILLSCGMVELQRPSIFGKCSNPTPEANEERQSGF